MINIPTQAIAKIVVGIGNCTGAKVDKFDKFMLNQVNASKVKAPLIKECYANFECEIADSKLINRYNFFIFKVVKAHVALKPKYPDTIHYRGDSIFMLSGKNIKIPSKK